MAEWSRIARRIRVPLGFLLAVGYLWLARPTWFYLALGAVIVVPGLLLRALAAGHIRKNAELTTTGPYAHTRNPLYLGSTIIAIGFAVASRSLWVAAALVVMFAGIYLPVIRAEEQYLRATFPEFADYARRVPRLLPRWRRDGGAGRAFSRAQYLGHREYNALLGSAAIFLVLIVKLMWAGAARP